MPISETISYIIIFGLTVIFTVFALTMQEYAYKLLLKLIAATCWFIMAVIQFILGGTTSALTIPISSLFTIFGFIFCFSTIDDWQGEKKSSFQRSVEE